MTVLNDIDRFHLVDDALYRLPLLGTTRDYLKQEFQNKLIELRNYIRKNGMDLPEIRNWKWKE